ncbi:hypothetical protein CAOG_00861 [Capsaspora owczarzaki ATCC 30864]|uniref:PX domain-containing protein n=1 Tax=Capsaspora owczarzaki (strain ATCC 30864) TaxID=595528 RepID=A0A0D2WJ91_CAPO3|nr:hypothetical protein CAOG_00861 [Capsaspora owczarzaki ATCC 30864]KJE89378.1 hypothetical protein CAOG_000861 [Capsaspora owczarzaki ATCC 30864]|eukprot:XP_004365732.1 hypothetical protein CAOG_00861 [Capsaspora owczarzaki ATCC 30864]
MSTQAPVLSLAKIASAEQWTKPTKRWMFVIELVWSNNTATVIYRDYDAFFDFQCNLLDKFPTEAGSVKGTTRSIPYLPGKVLFNANSKAVAEKRVEELNEYIEKLLKLPSALLDDTLTRQFFAQQAHDQTPAQGAAAAVIGDTGSSSPGSVGALSVSGSRSSLDTAVPRTGSGSRLFSRKRDSKLSAASAPAVEEVEMTDNPLTRPATTAEAVEN